MSYLVGDSNVIGYDDDVGFDDYDDGISGYDDEVGRRGRRRGGGGGSGVSVAQLKKLAKQQGLKLVRPNPNAMGGRGATVPGGILPTNQRLQPAAFTDANALAAGAAFTLEADVQKGFQLVRLMMQATFDVSGNDASGFVRIQDIKVGTRSQFVSNGLLSMAMFSPFAVRADLSFDPAKTGNNVYIIGYVLSTAPAALSVAAGGIGMAGE